MKKILLLLLVNVLCFSVFMFIAIINGWNLERQFSDLDLNVSQDFYIAVTSIGLWVVAAVLSIFVFKKKKT